MAKAKIKHGCKLDRKMQRKKNGRGNITKREHMRTNRTKTKFLKALPKRAHLFGTLRF